MKIQTDHVIEHSRSDIIELKEKQRKYIIVDVACPFDKAVTEKEKVKVKKKYQDLKREVK